MKKIISVLLAVACLTAVTSCKKDKGESTPPKGELTFSAVNTKTGFNPAAAHFLRCVQIGVCRCV